MTCLNCRNHLRPGRRGKPRETCCSECRRAADLKARRLGRAILRRSRTMAARPRDFVARVKSYPGPDRRWILGKVARELGVI